MISCFTIYVCGVKAACGLHQLARHILKATTICLYSQLSTSCIRDCTIHSTEREPFIAPCLVLSAIFHKAIGRIKSYKVSNGAHRGEGHQELRSVALHYMLHYIRYRLYSIYYVHLCLVLIRLQDTPTPLYSRSNKLCYAPQLARLITPSCLISLVIMN